MISAGAKKDLLVLMFAKSLIEESQRTDDEDVLHIESEVEIDKAIDDLSQRLSSTIDKLMQEHGQELLLWLRRATERRVKEALVKIMVKTISLEMLAVWILYVNFCERDKTIIVEFQEYIATEQYLDIICLLEHTNVSKLEQALFLEAYNVIGVLKC